MPFATRECERLNGSVVLNIQSLGKCIGDELRPALPLIPERGVHELAFFDMVEVVVEHLLHGRHREFVFQPCERDLLEVATPDFLVVRLEIEVVERIAEPSTQECLKVCRFRGLAARDSQAIFYEAALRVAIQHVHVILYRIGNQCLLQLDDRVSVSFVEVCRLVELAPEPLGNILILCIEHMSAAGMKQAATNALASDESTGLGCLLIDGHVISTLQDAGSSQSGHSGSYDSYSLHGCSIWHCAHVSPAGYCVRTSRCQ